MSRHVYMVRHTDAVEGEQMDSSRPLTKLGQQEAAKIAKWLARQIGRVDIVITSPFLRTVQTAEYMGEALGAHLASTNGLEPEGRTAAYAWEEITRLMQQSEDILLVGHGPALSTLCLWLMGYDGDNEELRFDHGSISRLKIEKAGDVGKGDGKLHWLIEPKLVLPADEVVEAAEALLNMGRKPRRAFSVTEARKASWSKKLREAFDEGATDKAWVGGTCEDCLANEDAGWIDMDESFPSGDDEPPAHPNCDCDIETRDASGEDAGDYVFPSDMTEAARTLPMGEEALVKVRQISELEDGGQLWQVTPA